MVYIAWLAVWNTFALFPLFLCHKYPFCVCVCVWVVIIYIEFILQGAFWIMRVHSFWAHWCPPYVALRTSVKAVTHRGAAAEGSCSHPVFQPHPSGDIVVSHLHLPFPQHPLVHQQFPPLQTLTFMLLACGREMLPCLTMNSWLMYILLLVSQVREVSHRGCTASWALVLLKVLIFPRDLNVI